MLPLGLLNAAQGHPMLVELKNGETLNGHLVNCDTWMNLTLKEVVQTSPEGDKFFRLAEVYIRGSNIKYLRVPDEIIELVKDQQQSQSSSNRGARGGGPQRGDHSSRGDRSRGGRAPEPSEALPSSKRNSLAFEAYYTKLHNEAFAGNYHAVQYIVDFLLKNKHEAPNIRLYGALILANVDPANGSAEAVATLLKEMKAENIGMDSSIYHSALRALSVHPDYLLRDKILQEMESRWFTLTPDAWHDVVAGCIRGREFEIALEKLNQMEEQGIIVQPWLYDMITYVLIEIEELEEALHILMRRAAKPTTVISAHLWYHFLDASSRLYYYDGTKYCWQKQVENYYLNPPDGMCLNVLNTAARHQDSQLATDVFRVLGNRSFQFELYHYEALLEAHSSPDTEIKTMLTLLCLMKSLNMEPTEASTRAVLSYLQVNRYRPLGAYKMLQMLHQEGRVIPTPALNCIIEASISHGNLNQAIDFYKMLPTLCPDGPTIYTFNALLRGCALGKRKDVAKYVEEEMEKHKIKPDFLSLDRLVIVFSNGSGYKEALRYYDEMSRNGWIPRAGTFTAMMKGCAENKDPKAWAIVKKMRENDMPIRQSVTWLRILKLEGEKKYLPDLKAESWGKSVSGKIIISANDVYSSPDSSGAPDPPSRGRHRSLLRDRSEYSSTPSHPTQPPTRLDRANLTRRFFISSIVIVTSGPSSSYPQLAYRNPLATLVKFLDGKHGDDWAIWEFRAEGTGYPDEEVYGRVWHYPWPDHHPPPFALIPNLMASMRNWLSGNDNRVVVVHCKAGKGRSGTATCSYLISECGWDASDAIARFTERRMRPGFGQGVSIPSQLRWVGYVDRWTKGGKIYVERKVEITEIHVWGLRRGVKVAVEGFVEDGKIIKRFHVFRRHERIIMDDLTNSEDSAKDGTQQNTGTEKSKIKPDTIDPNRAIDLPPEDPTELERGGDAVIFRPSNSLILPTNDINIDFERRNTATRGWALVTAVAHVWFNAFFEGKGPEQDGKADANGVFEIDWDKMDGIKGSSRKGMRAFDRIAAIWKAVDKPGNDNGILISEPAPGEEVKQMQPADWKGGSDEEESLGKELGLRTDRPDSEDLSRASSAHSSEHEAHEEVKFDAEVAGLDCLDTASQTAQAEADIGAKQEGIQATRPAEIVGKVQAALMKDLAGAVPHGEHGP
ncbi:MAG: Telomerase protein component 1 [Trizodia sp. TS-e1964]|nr:MAG: Telomerase protein component 1 [Trizodia sp. TS-e1964]